MSKPKPSLDKAFVNANYVCKTLVAINFIHRLGILVELSKSCTIVQVFMVCLNFSKASKYSVLKG